MKFTAPYQVKVLYQVLTKEERLKFIGIASLSIASSLVAMLGIISVVPFLAMATQPELVQSNYYFKIVYDYLNFTNIRSFLLILGLVSLILFILNNILQVYSSWLVHAFSLQLWRKLMLQVFSYYIRQPYSYYLTANSSELTNRLMVQVHAAIGGVVTPLLFIISQTVIGIPILLLLLWNDPILTLTIFAIFGIFYVFLYKKFQKKIAHYGNVTTDGSAQMQKLFTEVFSGIKEVKAYNIEKISIDKLNDIHKEFFAANLNNQKISLLPGACVDTLAFGTIFLIALYLIYTHNEFHLIIPTVGLYAISIRRVVPAMQSIFLSLGQMKFHKAHLLRISPELIASIKEVDKSDDKIKEEISFNELISLKNISYYYSGSSKQTIKNINIDVPSHSTIGIVGGTGAGKTTLVDIVLGLLTPTSGSIVIDGIILNDNNASEWVRHIGYVPQHIYLIDDSVSRNIAFGKMDNEIDYSLIKKAAKLANIDKFIEEELPSRYETMIGDRGIRLSGGQRQRLGIARALYNDPDLLILDEATSALDGITERQVMSAVAGLAHKKTIIIIAHRLTTLKNCDVIYIMEEGEIIGSGTYDQLIKTHDKFMKMANVI